MGPKKAVIMAAIFNFLGLFLMTLVSSKVVATIGNLVRFSNSGESLTALAAGLFAIIIWAVAAWYFGIPTSESHALIAGVTGAAISIMGFGAFNAAEWTKVLYGLAISSVIGMGAGYFTVKFVQLICKRFPRGKTIPFFKGAQVFSGAAMAFLHGAQDGQKFLGVFMLGLCLANGTAVPASFDIPFYSIVLFSVVMGIGTSIGGYRIIKAVRNGYG